MGLNTISYSETAQAFSSFLSSNPKWYMKFSDRYYSFDENNIMYQHNNNGDANSINLTLTYNYNLHPRWNDSSNSELYGTNILNLDLLPSGIRTSTDGTFSGIGNYSIICLSDDAEGSDCIQLLNSYSLNYIQRTISIKSIGRSIRLIRELYTKEEALVNGTILNSSNSDHPTYTDYDGNIYECVKIGNLVFITTNLKTVHYADGTIIPTNLSNSNWIADTTGAMAVYGKNDGTFVATNELTTEALMVAAYGRLYNWYAVVNSHGLVMPGVGWRVPAETDIVSFYDYMRDNYGYLYGDTQFKFIISVDVRSVRQIGSNNIETDKLTIIPSVSYIRTIINKDYIETKTFDNVSYSADFDSADQLSNIYFETEHQTSDVVTYIDKREDTYKISIPRDTPTQETLHFIDVYGYLYNWYAVSDSRQLAPTGWHIPTVSEFNTLISYIGGGSIGGGKLKENGSIHWINNLESLDTYGFKLLPGGQRQFEGNFGSLGTHGMLYQSNEYDSLNGSVVDVYNLSNTISNGGYGAKYIGWSVRCIKDNSTNTGTVTDIDGNIYTTVTIGTQVWTASNLRVTKYRNGDVVPTVTDNSAWATLTTGAKCSYNNLNPIIGFVPVIGSRMRGKYMVSNFTFQSTEGNYFTLPYIETTYRYSSI
jgi:uncharacterized protein (TIGR02145 family)